MDSSAACLTAIVGVLAVGIVLCIKAQHRPPPGCNEVRQIRTGTRFLSLHLKFTLGCGLFCAGEGGPLG